MGSNRDAQRIMEQENKDYIQTRQIMTILFGNWTTTFQQMDEFSPSDMRFTATRGERERKYNVEIKSRNQDMTKYDTLPLTQRKLQRLRKDTAFDERLIFVVLVNESEYFIYDLYMLDFNEIELRDWHVKKQEYNINGSDYEDVPTYFIPTDKAVKHGYYYAHDKQT